MVAVATAGHPAFAPSDIELRRDGPSYTVDTLTEWLRESPADALFVIVGSDTFAEMPSWKEPERVFALCTVAVVGRPGDAPFGARSRAGRVVAVEGPGLAISSTEVRQRVATGRSVRYLVPEAVADYVVKRGLYR
jgi:nicotinate-nucleotide adenylyltransferase